MDEIIKKLYPLIYCEEVLCESQKDITNGYHIKLETYLRKEFDNRWFITKVILTYKIDTEIWSKNKSKILHSLYQRFNSEVYNLLYLAKYVDATDLFGDPVWVLDTDQTSEKDRLTKIIQNG